jgi:alkylation response protein AidB-like acyl-CoA dehydrogenase
VNALEYALAIKEVSKADAGTGVALAVTCMVAETIAHFGTVQQKEKFLPRIASGELIPASFALTEKQAGSDPKQLSTVATAVQGAYVLNGEKKFTTSGDLAGIYLILAKLDDAISAFIVEKGAAGLEVIYTERKMGLLSVNLVSLKLEECRAELLGNPGRGLQIALQALDSGRIGIAAQAVGIAEAALGIAVRHATTRSQFGKLLSEQEVIAFKLADMQLQLDAARLLLYKACWLKDQGQPFTLAASEAKLFCSEACNFIADQALQIHGGYGYVKDCLAEKYFRDARATTLYEGTSEIQRLVIARLLLNTFQDQGQFAG